ncbi:MAG: matrixin family metalloprotease [Myxococcota bacterium]
MRLRRGERVLAAALETNRFTRFLVQHVGRVLMGACLATTACAPENAATGHIEPTGDLFISPEFSAEQQEVLIGAIAAWRDATQAEVDLRVQIGSGSPQLRPSAERDGVFGEFIPSSRPEILIDTQKAADPRALRNLTLHEIGHALGIGHIPRANSIMFPYATTLQELDPWTLDAWRSLHDVR